MKDVKQFLLQYLHDTKTRWYEKKSYSELQFLYDLIGKIEKNKINFVILGGNDGIYGACNGYFDASVPEFAVRVTENKSDWFPVLVHESSHLDQFLEGHSYFKTDEGTNASLLFDEWLKGTIEFNEDNLGKCLRIIQDVEYDCEKRSIEKIKEHGLDIDLEVYAKKANAYVLFYYWVAHSRKWYELGKEPYTLPQIWDKMPNELISFEDFSLDKFMNEGYYTIFRDVYYEQL